MHSSGLLDLLLDIGNCRLKLGIDPLREQSPIQGHLDVGDHAVILEYCAVKRALLNNRIDKIPRI
jgi:hypothetical protein